MSREDWTLLDPLSDESRAPFERLFPNGEIPIPCLCSLVVEFRAMRRQTRATKRLAPALIERKVESLEKSVNDLLRRLEPYDPELEARRKSGTAEKGPEGIRDEVCEAIPGTRINLIRELRDYRSALWSARPLGASNETGALVRSLKRHFERHGLASEIDATEGGRFVRAVLIALEAMGTKITKAEQQRSLVETVRYHLE